MFVKLELDSAPVNAPAPPLMPTCQVGSGAPASSRGHDETVAAIAAAGGLVEVHSLLDQTEEGWDWRWRPEAGSKP